jgi:hypothetical protein
VDPRSTHSGSRNATWRLDASRDVVFVVVDPVSCWGGASPGGSSLTLPSRHPGTTSTEGDKDWPSCRWSPKGLLP